MSEEGTISIALHTYLAGHLEGEKARRFFRLEGFDDTVYELLLARIQADSKKLAGQPLWVYTTGPIPGYEDYALEDDRSATWYRNNVPPGCTLVLIFNRRTSDAQSLKDIYSVTESLLATEGRQYLIDAAFTDYQPSRTQVGVLTEFLTRLRRVLFQPQLRDLVAFMHALNAYLDGHPGATVEEAIAESLPLLGLFRCRELADVLNISKGDRLLREVHRAARLAQELLDEKLLSTYLRRLEDAEFDDDSPYGGLPPEEKRSLLHRFLTEVLIARADIVHVLQLDWREVAPVLHKSRRRTRGVQMQELAAALETALQLQRLSQDALPDPVQDALLNLREGQEPEDEGLDILLAEYGDSLPSSLRNKLRRLRGTIHHQTTDFIGGVSRLAVELLAPLQEDLPAKVSLLVRLEKGALDRVTRKEAEALLAFRILYGGIEMVMPQVQWDLRPLWDMAQRHSDMVEEEDEEGEREKRIVVPLPFHIAVTVGDKDLGRAELAWQYRSDGPAAATLANLQAEARRIEPQDLTEPLFANAAVRCPVPVYNTCPPADEIGDLDLSRPMASLGAWYHEATDLGARLRDELAPRASPEAWAAVETALGCLEQTWAGFVRDANERGVLAADLDALLSAYEGLLQAAAENLRQGQEILHGFRLLTQAWVVGPDTFDEWAVLPFLHPLKLQWWRARARRFNGFIARLLSPGDPAPIVDERRFRQEMDVTHGSAGYPAVLALPGRDRRSDYFLPVHEVDGYELYCHVGQAGIAYGLDPDLVSDDESEQAADVAARELARVVQDYIETYPFVRDGLGVYLVQCRNGALPGLLVEQLDRLARRHRWSIRLNVVVHSTDRGAPLYRRVTEWLQAHEEVTARTGDAYFPRVTLRVLECGYDDLFHQVDGTDVVILPDVLAEQGQIVEAEAISSSEESSSSTDGLPLYRALQAPFERGEFTRTVLLSPPPQPALLQRLYAIQWAARERKPVPTDQIVQFRRRVSVQNWEQELAELHRRFNWVTCYDTTVDRFLLEDTFPGTVEVIRYSMGLGIKRRHNLTVSSSYQARDIVERRLTANLKTLLPGTSDSFRFQVAQRLVEEAKHISGDIVLRAAGPGAYLNELIGMVAAKYQTEHRYLEKHPGALSAWIYLDDFAHWFDGRTPDLLFVAIPPESNGELPLHIEVLETKCVGETNFATEAADAQRQIAQGVNRLAQAWASGAAHLDAPFWYDQLYRAVVGNLAVGRDQRRLWEVFRRRLPQGDYSLEMSGHAWVFCHNGAAGVAGPRDEGVATIVAPDVQGAPHYYHHYGRVGLRQLLRNLVDEWQLETPADTWSPIHDEPPLPRSEEEATIADDVPTSLVDTSGVEQDRLGDWIQQKAEQLNRVLRDYNLRVYPVKTDRADVGPSVVRFKIRLHPGEKLGRLQAVAADLQRELALTAVPLIDNVLGTTYVGIDIPRPEAEAVPLLPALSELPDAPVGRLPFLVGQSPAGRTIRADLADLPHLLVAGSTGSGKTILLYTLIAGLVHQFSPKLVSLLLIDPKQTDFVYFEDLPHLMDGRVVIDADEAITYLDQLTAEILEERTSRLREARCRDILDYNDSAPDAPMVPIVVVIDEYADLVQVLDRGGRAEFERRLVRLAQRARNVGIHLVIATQRPSADIVTTSLKTNLPARIAFRLPSHHDSMTILGQSGAENLLGKGDMLFLFEGRVERLQGFFIGPDDLVALLQRE